MADEKKIEEMASKCVEALTPILEGVSYAEIKRILYETREKLDEKITLTASSQINREEAFKEAFDVIQKWLQSALQPNVSRETLNHLSFSAKQAYEIHKKYLSQGQDAMLMALLQQFPNAETTT